MRKEKREEKKREEREKRKRARKATGQSSFLPRVGHFALFSCTHTQTQHTTTKRKACERSPLRHCFFFAWPPPPSVRPSVHTSIGVYGLFMILLQYYVKLYGPSLCLLFTPSEISRESDNHLTIFIFLFLIVVPVRLQVVFVLYYKRSLLLDPHASRLFPS